MDQKKTGTAFEEIKNPAASSDVPDGENSGGSTMETIVESIVDNSGGSTMETIVESTVENSGKSSGMQPVTLVDIYGDQYRIEAPLAIPDCYAIRCAGKRFRWTLLSVPDYPGSDCSDLSNQYRITREDGNGEEQDVEEILLPASEIRSGDTFCPYGVVLTKNLENCIRGDQWHPDWLSSESYWRILARLADGIGAAIRQKVCPFKLTRDRLFIDETTEKMYLAVARANRITEEMREDPWLLASMPPELGDCSNALVGAEQTAYAFAAMALSLWTDWTPANDRGTLITRDKEGKIASLDKIPRIFPLRGELTALMTEALSEAPEKRPSVEVWRDQLNHCADEMHRRLAGAWSDNDTRNEEKDNERERPSDTAKTMTVDVATATTVDVATATTVDAATATTADPATVIAADAATVMAADTATAMAADATTPELRVGEEFEKVTSQSGCGWLLAKDGMTAVRDVFKHYKAYQPPVDNWLLWDARFDKLTTEQRKQFKVLRFPVDQLLCNGSRYVVFEDSAPADAETFLWENYSDPQRLQKDLKSALQLVASLIEDMALAQKMGVSIGVFSTRQLVNLPEAAVVLCGQNIRSGHAMSPFSVGQHLLSGIAGTAWISSGLNRLLSSGMNVPADIWVQTLRMEASRLQRCPHCSQWVMPGSGSICPGCGYSALDFQVHRDVEPRHENIILAADGSAVKQSFLYPGGADTSEICLTWNSAQQYYTLTNLSDRTWKCITITGRQTIMLKPQETIPLEQGIRISVLPRKLELLYNGLHGLNP